MNILADMDAALAAPVAAGEAGRAREAVRIGAGLVRAGAAAAAMAAQLSWRRCRWWPRCSPLST